MREQSEFLRFLGPPLGSLLPLAAAWAYARRLLSADLKPAAVEPGTTPKTNRPAGWAFARRTLGRFGRLRRQFTPVRLPELRRLYEYALALFGLAGSVYGLYELIGLLVNSLAGTAQEDWLRTLAQGLAALAVGLAAVLRWPLSLAQRIDLTYSYHWPDPSIVLSPEPDDGPVLITVEYRVPAERERDYLQAMKAMRGFRRREGAVRWDLFQDMADPERYVESFMVMTWGEHMRQHTRVTREDEAIETYAFSFLKEGVSPLATHYIAAQAQNRQKSAEPIYPQIS